MCNSFHFNADCEDAVMPQPTGSVAIAPTNYLCNTTFLENSNIAIYNLIASDLTALTSYLWKSLSTIYVNLIM